MIDELKLIDNIDVLIDNKIVLYGAGATGVKALKMLKETGMPAAAYFCDGDPRKWGTFVEGVEVLSPSELKQLDESENLAIIIASEHVPFIDQIAGDIAWLKLRTDNIFTLFGLVVSLMRNNKALGLNGGHFYALQSIRRETAFALHTVRLLEMYARWAEKTEVFLVYAIGKTGTTTILNSLSKINIFADHLHRLCKMPRFSKSSIPLSREVLENYRQDVLNIFKSRKSVKIISMMREPVSRILSRIFQSFRFPEFGLGDVPPGKSYVNSITEIVAYKKWEGFINYEPLNYFDKELKAVFGIDVYAHPFYREKGYSIIKHGNAEALVMKLEKLNSLEQVIAEFVGAPRFKLVNANEGDKAPYKYLYKQVKEAIKIPREVFDFYYKDPRLAHFYSEEEVAGFWKKWENNIAD